MRWSRQLLLVLPMLASLVFVAIVTASGDAFSLEAATDSWGSGAPAIATDSAGSAHLFTRGANGEILHRTKTGSDWSASAESLGGAFTTPPAATVSNPGVIHVFARGADNALYENVSTASGGWSGWRTLGGYLAGVPAAASPGPGLVDVFAQGGDHALWMRSADISGDRTDWVSLGGEMATASGPGAFHSGDTTVVVIRGADSALWMKSRSGQGDWSSWVSLGGATYRAPAITSSVSGRFDVYIRGVDQALWHRAVSADGSGSNWERLGGSLSSAPAASAPPDGGTATIVAYSNTGDYIEGTQTPAGEWSGWHELGAPASTGTTLSWAPPRCGDSTHACVTINVASSGHQTLGLSGSNDYILNLPADRAQVGGLTLYGGHNIIIIGGQIDLPTPCTSDSGPCHGINISRRNSDTGTVHIEGVYIRNPDPSHSHYTGDGIDANGLEGTDLQLENLRIEGIDGCDRGDHSDAHADVFQPYGGVRDIRVDRLTGTTDFQGMEIKEGDLGSSIRSATYRNVNINGFANPHGCTGSQYLWWLTSTSGGFNCDVPPTVLSNAYADPVAPFTIGRGVLWPDSNTDFGCPLSVNDGAGRWPRLTAVTDGDGHPGSILEGQPPGGDFVPVGTAGIGYDSPGYDD